MDYFKGKSYLANQIFVVSGVLATILSCGLGIGFNAVVISHSVFSEEASGLTGIDGNKIRFIETAGEVTFLPSIVVIPYIMQKKGRRIASIITIIPLLFGWLTSFDSNNYISLLTFNVLHHISLGGAVAISSVVISEFCSPKYRGTFLMLETAMISLGVLLSHVACMAKSFSFISGLGLVTAAYSLTVSYFWPESPYWLISQGHIMKCTDSFHWLRGKDGNDFKELEDLLQTEKLRLQLEALKPIQILNVKERILICLKSLLKKDFLKPLSIMILLFSFVGFGSENVISSNSFKDIIKLTNGKYIGTIVLDVLSLILALTACVLIQIVKRKTLFIFTGAVSILLLASISFLIFLQSLELLSKDYTWIFLSLVTGFVMFISLGTTALPFSLLGEIFPMTYKGVGSSLTCAYLWAFGNTIIKSIPSLTDTLGYHGTLILFSLLMVVILIIVNRIVPETNTRTLLEIEELLKDTKNGDDYEVINDEDRESNFDKLKLFIEV